MIYDRSHYFYEPLGQKETDDFWSMTYEQKAFLCGLIRDRLPRKILEVGVYEGSTTCSILSCIDKLDYKPAIHSVDILDVIPKTEKHPEKAIGYRAEELNESLKQDWTLYKDGTIAEYIDQIGRGIDFCILDTAHSLPGELLDFLVIFPYLSRDAVVVIHDVILQSSFDRQCATMTLFSSVAAEKYISLTEEGHYENIAAFQVTQDTEKYLDNVFLALSLPWTYDPNPYFVSYERKIRQQYPSERVKLFENSAKVGFQSFYLLVRDIYHADTFQINRKITESAEHWNIAFWGTGMVGNRLVQAIEMLMDKDRKAAGILRDSFFVDSKARTHDDLYISRFPVRSPECLTASAVDAVVITVEEQTEVYKEIEKTLLKMGFKKSQIYSISEFFIVE